MNDGKHVRKKNETGLSIVTKKLFIHLIYLILIVFAFACSNEIEEDRLPLKEEQVEIPDHESWDSNLITTESGNITAEIEYGYMAKFNEKKEYRFEKNIVVKFYDENGNIKSTIHSDKGLLKESQKYMEVFGNVVAHSDSSNITLYTEKLQWREEDDKIISNEEVKITTDYDTLFGLGFESDVDLKHWQIKKPHDGRSTRKIGDDIDKHFESSKKK
jgi:LPS export ABC transporter protein LptC